MAVYVLHENPDWFLPFGRAFAAAGVDYQEWLLTTGTIDLNATPPEGIFYNRLSASSHTHGRAWSRDYARAILEWLEAHGRRVVNGRSVVEMEVGKVRQLTRRKAFGIDVPRTAAVVGREDLVATAERFPMPFITRHNQSGKGLGVRRFDNLTTFRDYLASDAFERPPTDATSSTTSTSTRTTIPTTKPSHSAPAPSNSSGI